jgi:hypothetical protein
VSLLYCENRNMKTCTHCACTLPLTEFRPDRHAKADGKSKGVDSACRFCQSLARQRWKRDNADRARELRRDRKRRLRAAARADKGPYVPPLPLRVTDPEAWREKKRARKRAERKRAAERARALRPPKPQRLPEEELRRRSNESKRRFFKENPHVKAEKKRAREAAKLGATPTWADRDEMRQWYHVAQVLSRGGVQFHVDHIVPLRGETVCGLHVPANLTVLPWHLNASKGHRYWPDMP